MWRACRTGLFGRINAPLRPVNNKVIVPDEAEIERNPRSRSAKLENRREGIDMAKKGKNEKGGFIKYLKLLVQGRIFSLDFSDLIGYLSLRSFSFLVVDR